MAVIVTRAGAAGGPCGAMWRTGTLCLAGLSVAKRAGGVDAASLVLGNPFHAVWGEPCARVHAISYRRHRGVGMDSGERAGVDLAGCVVQTRRVRRLKPWALAGTVFMVWALGPWLIVFGRQTP